MRSLVLLLLVVPYRVGCDSCEPIPVRSTEDAGTEQPDSSVDAAVDAGTEVPDAGQDAGPDAGQDAGTLFNVWLGIQGSDGRSRVQRLTFDAVANTAALSLEADLTVDGGPIPTSSLRAISLLSTGELLVGAESLSGWVRVDGASMSATALVMMDASRPLRGVHGACELAGGDLVLGEFGGAANQYTDAGRFVATFSPAPRYTMASCAQSSAQQLFWVDYDGLSDTNGDVVMSVLDGGVWEEAARFDSNAQLLSLPDSSFYALVRDSDGFLYVFPQSLGPNCNGRVLRCSLTGALSDCAPWGVDLTTLDSGLGFIQGAHELPGLRDILFIGSDNLRLYRYDPAQGTAVLVADLAAQGLTRVEPYFGVRGLLVRAR